MIKEKFFTDKTKEVGQKFSHSKAEKIKDEKMLDADDSEGIHAIRIGDLITSIKDDLETKSEEENDLNSRFVALISKICFYSVSNCNQRLKEESFG